MIATINALSFLTFLALLFKEVLPRNRWLAAIFAAWVLAYGAVAASGYLVANASAFPPMPIRAMFIVLVGLAATYVLPKTRALWDAIPTEHLVRLHTIRAPIGLMFLISGAQGILAPEFATRAGWGDLLAGTLAFAYVMLPALRRGPGTLLVNVVGTVDLLMAVGTAALTVESPLQIYPHADLLLPLATLPGALVPGFAVPVLFFSHFLIYKRVLHK